MSADSSADATAPNSGGGEKLLFWACFISLVATAFGFATRGELLTEWAREFNLDEVQKSDINGAGVWPFAVSIILFSLIIDKIGYGKAMAFAFFSHIAYAVIIIAIPYLGVSDKTAYYLLIIGNVIFALGNGTVEAVINPVVATLFNREKAKWLNILHAGWPAGLVLTGIMLITLNEIHWTIKVGLIFIPVLIYGALMLQCKFPVSERVASGTSYKEMLSEFGLGGALIVSTLIAMQIGQYFKLEEIVQVIIGLVIFGSFAAFVRAPGSPIFFFLLLIMLPLATTEIGTDNWLPDLMRPAMKELGLQSMWLLVYTSFIMMVLRFFAGPIVHKLSPLGLLAVSCLLAAGGLYFLSQATGIAILAAATLYGFGKTFFWPTMLGIVSEQYPKGGALTLNATGGVGMLGVGVLGMTFIGLVQEDIAKETIETTDSVEIIVAADDESEEVEVELPPYTQISVEKRSVFGKYPAINGKIVEELVKEGDLSKDQQAALQQVQNDAKKPALSRIALLPCGMLVCYLLLIIYYSSQGGYKAEVLVGHSAHDEEFTGGVEGPADQ